MSTPSTIAPDRELLVLRRRPRRVGERLAVEAALVLLAVLATVVIAGSGPVDSRAVAWLAGGTGIGVVMLLSPVVLLRLALKRRVAVVLTAGGIGNVLGPGRTRWPDIIDIRTLHRLTERQVHVTSAAGTVLLHAPRGSGWLPDPTFRADVAALRALAVRHGSRILPSSKEQRTPILAAGLALVALMTAAGIRAAERGVIWPSAPTTSDVVAACPALQASGLDQLAADIRNPTSILENPVLRETIDFSRPVGLTLIAVLMLLADEEDPWAQVAALRDAMPSGSCLAITHPTADFNPQEVHEAVNAATGAGMTLVARSKESVRRFFGEWVMLEPGLVPLSNWRPDEPVHDAEAAYYWAGVARKP